MILADFNPAILFLLLWGLLSWFTKKKKKEARENLTEDSGVKIEKEDIFTRLQKLQDHLSKEVEIFPSVPEPVYLEEEYPSEYDEHSFEEPEILEPIPEIVDETEQYGVEANIKIPTTKHDNWLKKSLSQKSGLRKLMVLKAVLEEPLSIKPYTGDYYI